MENALTNYLILILFVKAFLGGRIKYKSVTGEIIFLILFLNSSENYYLEIVDEMSEDISFSNLSIL